MIAGEEKQFIFYDRSAYDSAELVALQSVALEGEEVARVQSAVAEELEQIAMKLVGAGLRDGVHRGAGVKAVLRLQHTGFHLELLQSIRERQRQRQVVVWILIDRAVQLVRDAIALAARHGHHDGRIIPHGVDRAVTWRARHTRKEYQFDRIAPIQWHLGDSQGVHYLADAGRTRLHLRGVGFHRYLFADCANLQPYIDREVAIHLEHDTRLDVRRETRLCGFQHIRPERKSGKHVPAIFAGGHRSNRTRGGLGHLDVGARYYRAGLIVDCAPNLTCGLCPNNSANKE